jgi:hypothetical protein
MDTHQVSAVQFILCINTYVSLIMHLFAMIPASIISITNMVGICMLALKSIMLWIYIAYTQIDYALNL